MTRRRRIRAAPYTARASVRRADELIGSLLALSRAESGMVGRERVDVADLVGDVVTDAAPAASAAGVSIDLTLADAAIVGDRVLIRSLVENLVRNALAYNRPGGSVDIDVRTDGDRVHVRIENTGRSLSNADVQALLRPFARGDGDNVAVAGSGIGTAVVAAVAAAHHGSFKPSARPGGGLVALVELPTG